MSVRVQNANWHQAEAERLLALAKAHSQAIVEKGSLPANDMTASLHLSDQMIAAAHVHALLARP